MLLSELAAYPIIALDSLSTARHMLESALHASGHASAPAHEVSFISTAIGMVRAGLGITVMSSSALGRAVMTGLEARLIDHPELNRDIVVVRKQSDARTGEIVVALVGDDESADEATVKTFHREPDGRIRLQPENAALEPIYADHVEILGKVTGVFRSLR